MAEAIKYSLGKEGFDADIALDGEIGLSRFNEGTYDLLILDLMLPGIDGLEVCKSIRRTADTPVIMLTAKDAEVDKVIGLELGADDYLTKPFGMRELLARVKALVRRSRRESGSERQCASIEGGDIVIALDRHEVVVRGRVVDIPPIEFRMLELFMKNMGKVLARDYLIAAGWQGEFYGQSKALDVHIRRLREKIEEDPANPRHIVTVRGIGYRFEPTS